MTMAPEKPRASERPQSTGSARHPADAASQFGLAVGHHQAGRLREAEQHYRQALAADPLHGDSLHLLGVLAHQVGRSEIAVELIGKALARNDRVPDYHYNIGLGGLMNIALYSTLARQNITAARGFIAEHGWPATPEGIRAARQAILALPEGAPERRVALIGDFFALSDCRDLLFHVQEHTFGLPEVAAFLAGQELEFLGFEVGTRVERRYADRFPDDPTKTSLDRWHMFEQENPDTFIATYQFWVQKRGGTAQPAAQ
jgi:tetratricopeptide (TPR) repeat protein